MRHNVSEVDELNAPTHPRSVCVHLCSREREINDITKKERERERKG